MMYLITFGLAVAGALAAPVIESRSIGIVWIEYFPEADCQGEWLENNVFVDRGQDTCAPDPTTTWKPYNSFLIRGNDATRALNFFSTADCSIGNGGTVVTAPGGHAQCYNQHIGSVQFA
ncbi:hypothetical protein B0I35DRAFT_427632 [Stachybotrys elegans]|uniref:Uncharacterized protein n=1 Tax=Stachybotrys elegans TaxID=80388 RepID=A0A8K0WSD0_9HYPO|nr:hypothetical protein B0I35DRAFT_427632 [Stachybotrys elegans]